MILFYLSLATVGIVCPEQVGNPSITTTQSSTATSFKLIGDNIDKNVKVRYMRSDHRNTSLHYFHSFAVQDRIDFSHLPDTFPLSCSNSPHKVALELLPTIKDDNALEKLFRIHVSRILATHMEFFKVSCGDVAERHIQHEFYKQMSMKSTVVRYKININYL